MRNRSIAEVTPAIQADVENVVYTGACTGAGTTVTTHSYETNIRRSYSKVMNDVVTPQFQELVSKGKIINSPMDSVETESISEHGSYSSDLHLRFWNKGCTPNKYTYWRQTANGTRDSSTTLNRLGLTYLGIPAGADVDHLVSLAVTTAWANVEDCSVDVITTLAEFKMTVSSLVSITRRMINIVRFLRTKNYFKLGKQFTAKELADRYLELRYSLRPLFYDIKGFYRHLNTPNLKSNTRKTFRGRENFYKNDQDTKKWSVNNTWNAGTDHQEATAARSSIRSVEVRAGVLTTVKSSTWLDRWGFDNIFEAMWELTPFSFMVDWIFNVGKTIAAWTPEVGLHALASWYVVEDRTYQFVSIVDSSRTFAGANGWSYLACSFDFSNLTMSKTVITRYRVPNPNLDIFPTYKIRLDLFKLTDLLLILNQLRK